MDTLIQDARRLFNQTKITPYLCSEVLLKVLSMLYRGDTIQPEDAEALFVLVTKLFQSNHIALRRVVYLVLKELVDVSESKTSALISLNILCKDVTMGKVDVNRANSLRAIAHIVTPALIGTAARVIEQCIVDQNDYVATSALCAGSNIFDKGEQSAKIVSNWSPKIVKASQKRGKDMLQYHALSLLYKIKKHDQVFLAKLVLQLVKTDAISSPYSHCLCIRFTRQILLKSYHQLSKQNRELMQNYLANCLQNKSTMVKFEAARSIASLTTSTLNHFLQALTALQVFLLSNHSAKQFAAVRSLSHIAQKAPQAVATANGDLEIVMKGKNVQISTLAASTLLLTCDEQSVSRLLNIISGFLPQIDNESRISIVESVQILSSRFPKQYSVIATFISTLLREEGAFQFKKSLIDTLLLILARVPESKSEVLDHLCESIEDCEFPYLTTKIVHLLGTIGSQDPTLKYSKYVRHFYNRFALDNPSVRACAVDALLKIGHKYANIRPQIVVILKRCLFDEDNEVRDRSNWALHLLENQNTMEKLLAFQPNLALIEKKLVAYLESKDPSRPFMISEDDAAGGSSSSDISSVISNAVTKKPESLTHTLHPSAQSSSGSSISPSKVSSSLVNQLPDQLIQLNLGPLLKSADSQPLSDTEADIAVSFVLNKYKKHLVLEFECTNNGGIPGILKNLSISLEESSSSFGDPVPEGTIGSDVPLVSIPLDSLQSGQTGRLFIAFNFDSSSSYDELEYACDLNFDVDLNGNIETGATETLDSLYLEFD